MNLGNTDKELSDLLDFSAVSNMFYILCGLIKGKSIAGSGPVAL